MDGVLTRNANFNTLWPTVTALDLPSEDQPPAESEYAAFAALTAPRPEPRLPNAGLRLLLLALKRELGVDALRVALECAGLPDYVDRLPPDNLEAPNGASELARLEQGVRELYGPRGAPPVLLRAGRALFDVELSTESRAINLLARLLRLFAFLPARLRQELVLRQVVSAMNERMNLGAVLEEDTRGYTIVVHDCPCCYRPPQPLPSCTILLGALQQARRWIGRPTLEVREVSCRNAGADACRFRIAPPSRPE